MTTHVTSAPLVMRTLASTLAIACVATFASTASANPINDLSPIPPPTAMAPPPSPFETGMRGFGSGLVAGLAGGYLFAREDGFSSRDWRPLVAGAGVGALAGGALGVGLGIFDNNSASPGRGFLVMRDMALGGGFGAIAGGIVGGLAALSTGKPEHILFGAAIGTLTGTVLGVALGATEKNPWANSTRGPHVRNFGVVPYQTAQGTLAFGPSLGGTF